MQGQLDWMIAGEMNTVGEGLGGANEHEAAQAASQAPELNPQERVWDELREKEFPSRVYADIASVRAQLETGLPRLANDRKARRSADRLALDK